MGKESSWILLKCILLIVIGTALNTRGLAETVFVFSFNRYVLLRLHSFGNIEAKHPLIFDLGNSDSPRALPGHKILHGLDSPQWCSASTCLS